MPKLSDSIQYLSGVGEKRAKLFNKLGVDTIYSLLRFFPRDYINYANTTPIKDVQIGESCCVKGKVYKKQGETRIRKGLSIFKVYVSDGDDDMVVTLYNSKYTFDLLEMDKEYSFCGKMQGSLLRHEMNSPTFMSLEKSSGIQPVYHLTEGLSQKQISSCMRKALDLWGDMLQDVLPSELKAEEKLCHLRFAYENIHFPSDMNALEISKQRLILEELLVLQLGLILLKGRNREQSSVKITNLQFGDFVKMLPFELTDEQKQSINACVKDFKKARPMNRLVQGDVGSGKTMVACATAYCMANNSYQTAFMAPTEILATQHYKTFSDVFKDSDIKMCLLTGSVKASEKTKIKQQIKSGEIDIVIGTHAIIQDTVEFKSLGLVITDEQHRFGVSQRAKLSQKGENPHKLVMSATPIPRTLALIIYGDLDVSVIDKPPKGRLPIKTYLIDSPKRKRAYNFLKQHIDDGEQVYIVCPLVEESEVKEGFSVVEYADSLSDTVLKDCRIGVLHGKIKPKEKEQIMASFKAHEIDILVATTVIEVGVDVPNATIMMIENAENFGLSALHQLRGRVGRGKKQSHCILVSDKKGENTKERLKIMEKSNNGFYISEQDLKQRGPGDFFGERQHGLPALKIANMVDNMAEVIKTQEIAKRILQDDPTLTKPENVGLKELVDQLFTSNTGA